MFTFVCTLPLCRNDAKFVYTELEPSTTVIDDDTNSPMYDPVTDASDGSKHIFLGNYQHAVYTKHVHLHIYVHKIIIGSTHLYVNMCLFTCACVFLCVYVCILCMFLGQEDFTLHVYSSLQKPNKATGKPTSARCDPTKSSGIDELDTTAQKVN